MTDNQTNELTDAELDALTEKAVDILNRLDNEPLVNFTADEINLAFDHSYPPMLMANYMAAILKGNRKYNEAWRQDCWVDEEGIRCPINSHLFHANSVRTAFDFIRRRELYSREAGEGGTQTAQKSDDLDKQLLIYNDIFFDNTDIAYVTKTNTNAYGPVVFVFDPDIIRNKCVRITKINPFKFPGRIQDAKYDDLFFRSVDDIKEAIRKEYGIKGFLRNFSHHTTVFNTPTLPFENYLKYIYIEQKPDGSGDEGVVGTFFKQELIANGLTDVEVISRQAPPNRDYGYANDRDELWKLPEEFNYD